jgi:hypothetical protein
MGELQAILFFLALIGLGVGYWIHRIIKNAGDV